METKKTWFQRNKGLTIFLSFLVIIIIGLYAWNQIEKRSFNKKLENQRTEIISNSKKIIDEKRKNLVFDVVKTLSWAVRSEAQRNNFDQVNLYLNEFIKGKDFEVAMFVDQAGIITVSTDKRMEQTPFQDHYVVDYTSANEITLQPAADNKWFAAAPVMGLNNRIGTLILVYNPATIADEDFIVSE